jgi:hypothetical protein
MFYNFSYLYYNRQHISPAAVRNTVQTLLIIKDVANVLKSDISTAFLSDVKDFEKSAVPAILPAEMLKLIKNI